ncbi:hypothetical protein BDR26DRAFT_934958 [Obelidium mucronatum]|nr:hypothetical protein BDR26DRAFT_934958 [Obelidium mucronatum]
MEKVEKIVLGAAGPRQVPEPAEGEENAAPNPWKEAVAKPAVLKEWIKVLRSNVVDNAAWKQVITDTTEEVVEDSVVASPETKFYWAVVNLVEDAANLTVPAHTQFGIWARELTLADQTLAKSSLAPEVISGRSASQEPGRIASVLSTINAKTQELGTAISTSQTLKSLSTNTAQLGTSISSNTAQISTNIANSKVIENLSTGAQRLSSSARDLGTAIAASTYVEKASAGASKLGSAIASSTYVEKASTEATRLGTAISSNPYVEQASTGAQKLGTQVAEGAAKVSENLNVGVQVLQTKSKEIVSAVQAKMAAAPAAPVITEEMAAEHRKTIGPVSTITDGGDAVEKQKQAWDKTWDRLSSRLSTAKK